MKKKLRKLLSKFQLEDIAEKILVVFFQTFSRVEWLCRRRFGNVDKKLVRDYFQATTTPKLHVGCGTNVVPQWLNCDLFPSSLHVVHLDAVRPFPFPDSSFDFIFSEHMIEHVTFLSGQGFLRECFRVLKPGGVIRIATPDLAFLCNLYSSNKSQLQKDYLVWATKSFLGWADDSVDTHVINNFVRDWGHQYIYDDKVLSGSLKKAGFTGLRKCRLGESEHEALAGLENLNRMPNGFLELESTCWEGLKP